MIREIDYAGKAVLKDIGDSLAQGIWEEFVILVNETAQYTGSTAASWNLSMGGDDSVRLQPKRTRQQALQKGHQSAVQIALAHNFKSLVNITEEYRYRAIVVENNVEHAGKAETGPLRDVNHPAGAFFRFQQRLAFKQFEKIRERVL